jgi:hypothetical protein
MAVTFPVECLVAIAVAVFTFIALIVYNTKGDRRSQLVGAKKACRELIDKSNCGPILVRLAWHDSGEFSPQISTTVRYFARCITCSQLAQQKRLRCNPI